MEKIEKKRLSRIVEESLAVSIEFHSGIPSRIMPATVSGSNGTYVAVKAQKIGKIVVCAALMFSDRDVYRIFQNYNMFTIWLIA